jgi:predicted anti-sigma-YlaC factor YlaD
VVAAFSKLWAFTPAQVAALVFGVWWIGNGLTVFLATQSTFAALTEDGTVHVLGVSIAVNGWHGLFHLATGMAGIVLCWRPSGARGYALIVGLLYLAAALCGLFIGDTVFGVIRVDEFGSIDHALEGAVLLVAWLTSSRHPVAASGDRAMGTPG